MDGVGGRAGWRWDIHPRGCIHCRLGPYELLLLCLGMLWLRDFYVQQNENMWPVRLLRSGGEKFEWREVRKAFVAPHVWILGIVFFFSGAVLYGLALYVFPFLSCCYQFPDCIIHSFTPSIVQSLGYTAARS